MARPIASVAKIFTAMVALNLMPLDRPLTVPASVTALPWDSTLMGLTPGETLSVRELLDGALLVSGNNAAVTLAQGSTSQATFVADMNALAARIGLHSTHFANAVGLDDPGQYASAADLVTAAIYLDRNYSWLAGIAANGELDPPNRDPQGVHAAEPRPVALDLSRCQWAQRWLHRPRGRLRPDHRHPRRAAGRRRGPRLSAAALAWRLRRHAGAARFWDGRHPQLNGSRSFKISG